MIWGSGGSKSRLAKAAGAEPAGQMRDEKLHAVVARSTFASQNVQNTPLSDHFWKLRCRKSARRCGAKHISKSKCTKHTIGRTTFGSCDVEKVHAVVARSTFQVKMYKAHHGRTTFGSCDVEKVHAVVARSTFRSQNVQSTPWSDHFWRFRCRKSARCCGAKHISKVKMLQSTRGLDHFFRYGRFAFTSCYTTLKQCTPLWREASLHFDSNMYKTLHSTTDHYTGTTDVRTTLHYTPLHSTTLHYTTLHYTPLHYTTLHYTTLQITLHYIALHYTTLHYTTLHYTTLRYTTLHYTTLHYITLHDTTLHYTPLHYTTLHYTTLH